MRHKYHLAVTIGRFQPIHRGHVDLIRMATGLADHTLILVGSSNAAPSPRNPWRFNERREMIELSLDYAKVGANVYSVDSIDDSLYDDEMWINQIRWKVANAAKDFLIKRSNEDFFRGKTIQDLKICLVGFEKDSTSYYLRYFPEWSLESPVGIETIDATSIRNLFYNHFFRQLASDPKRDPDLSPYLMLKKLGADSLYGEHDYLSTDHVLFREPVYQHALMNMAEEWHYTKSYDPSKFPVFVTTVDTVVVCNGHVLIIKRKNAPGKGLYALPGGHVNPKEKLVDAALRELREETTIDVSNRILKNSIVDMKVFDHPERSERARVITHAYLIHLKEYAVLPTISHSDDAADAFWLPIGMLEKRKMFEDHYDIAQAMVKLL